MKPPCAHYWSLPEPNGPVSVGTCLKCGAVAEFRNSLPRTGWDSTVPDFQQRIERSHKARERSRQTTLPAHIHRQSPRRRKQVRS